MLQVVDHYENPRNVGSLDKNAKNVGTGLVGAPACGDVMKLQVRQLSTIYLNLWEESLLCKTIMTTKQIVYLSKDFR